MQHPWLDSGWRSLSHPSLVLTAFPVCISVVAINQNQKRQKYTPQKKKNTKNMHYKI